MKQILKFSDPNEILLDDEFNVIIINTHFIFEDIHNSCVIDNNSVNQFTEYIEKIATKCFQKLVHGGLLFVYGLPKYLPYYGSVLNSTITNESKMLFKYWIALDIYDGERRNSLKPTHLGLLMYLKTKNRKTTSPFHLNTKQVRVPYVNCSYCGKNIKDWGGKKHLINPLGACLSDIWRDIKRETLSDCKLPKKVIDRLYDLTRFPKEEEFKFLILEEKSGLSEIAQNLYEPNEKSSFHETIDNYELSEINQIFHGDSIEFMKKLHKKYPSGCVDFFFADPPYNLNKNYSEYDDEKKDKLYLDWVKEWIYWGSKILKPGGSMFILNLPKWHIKLATYLSSILEFRHWIAWDAMSTPSGKLMPAHYSLLYYTKPGKITFNYNSKSENDFLSPIDANIYCLRVSCIKKRKLEGFDVKEPLTDVWWDIHRIKHKKYRDSHPCQLPLNLMKRIISLSTNPGDTVFDPFSGAGSTAIAAKILGRNFISVDIDFKYVNITRRNLSNIVEGKDSYLPREKTSKKEIIVPRRTIEIEYISLCREHKRILELDEMEELNINLFQIIREHYPSFSTLKKIANRRLDWK